MMHNPRFIARALLLKDVYKRADYSNNCYSQAVAKGPIRSVKMHSVKLQCDVMELLGLDDLQQTEFPPAETDDELAIEAVTRRLDSDIASETAARHQED